MWLVLCLMGKQSISLKKHSQILFIFSRDRHCWQSLRRLARAVVASVEGGARIHFPHHAIKVGTSNQRERRQAVQQVPSSYEQQSEWLESIRKKQWFTNVQNAGLPHLHQPSSIPHFLIVHLFSGRRRSGDIHERLQNWVSYHGCQATVLSLDTAIAPSVGDLRVTSESWAKLLNLYEAGLVAATISGSPCETFTSARHRIPEGLRP